MKKPLLLTIVFILLLGMNQKFDGQEKNQSHLQSARGGKAVIEQQKMMAQPSFFSRQSPKRRYTDHALSYQQRMTNLMGLQDLRVAIAPTGRAFMQHELSAGVDTAWVRHYASGLVPSNDEATGIAVDSLGNVYVTGSSQGLPFGQDYLTAKYNSSGAQVWSARYDGGLNGDDCACAIRVDASGNIYVTGKSPASATGDDYATVKYNSAGVEQWVARYNGPGNAEDGATALAVDASGNVYVTGRSEGSDTGYDYATIKYNSAGAEEWVARYNGESGAEATALAVDASGNVYVTGTSGIYGGEDYLTVKYNSAGVEQWIARYDGRGNFSDWATAIAIDASGNVYVTGRSTVSNTWPILIKYDYATIKYNSAGAEQWVACYNGTENHGAEATALAVDASGNVYVTGTSGFGYESFGDEDYATIKYNSVGAELWVARYNGSEYEYSVDLASALAVDAFGNIIVTGSSTVKYNSDGILQWANLSYAAALAVDGSGNVYVTGTSFSSDTEEDYATVKYNSAGAQQWAASYNGTGVWSHKATVTDIAVDNSGNVYVTGTSGLDYEAPGGPDYATVKYNSFGAEQWVVHYDGTGNSSDNAEALAVDASGNVYVTGESSDSGTGVDYATVKYNSDGIQQWVTRYNGPGNAGVDWATAAAVDAAGNVYVTGESGGHYTWSCDYATVKYNSDGVEQWVARYNGLGNDYDAATAVAVDVSGNVYVTGISVGSGTDDDYATIKYNSDGVQQWVARYNGPGNAWDYVAALAVDSFGNIYVTGRCVGSSTEDDYATIKYNSDGVEQWVVHYNGPGNSWDYATALAVDGSGSVYVTGNSLGSGTKDDYATIKYNSDGVEQWSARYNGPGNANDRAIALAVDAFGNVYVTGWSEDSGTGLDYATIKYNSAGVEQWMARYNGPGNAWDYATKLVVDVSGNVYVTGTSQGDGWRVYTTIKYVQTPSVSVEKEEFGKPSRYWLAQNYPNPFNPSTTIEFALPQSAFVTLKIYNLLGEEVTTLIAEPREAGIHQLNWDARGLASGIYFYQLKAGEFVQMKKLILMR